MNSRCHFCSVWLCRKKTTFSSSLDVATLLHCSFLTPSTLSPASSHLHVCLVPHVSPVCCPLPALVEFISKTSYRFSAKSCCLVVIAISHTAETCLLPSKIKAYSAGNAPLDLLLMAPLSHVASTVCVFPVVET